MSDGRARAQMQEVLGTREIVEETNNLRIAFGFDNVTITTPIVETKLRSGDLARKGLELDCKVFVAEGPVLVFSLAFPLRGYPDTEPMSAAVCVSGEEFKDIEAELNILLVSLIGSKYGSAVNILRRVTNMALEYLETKQSAAAEVGSTEDSVGLDSTLENVNKDVVEDTEISPASGETAPEPGPFTAGADLRSYRFRCRTCRTALFSSADLTQHSRDLLHSTACSSYYLSEPCEWNLNAHEQEGKILCPTCKAKLGHWRWAGDRCCCKEPCWLAPAFQFTKSKVDPVLD